MELDFQVDLQQAMLIFEDLKDLCDVMYIGGTKIGLLLGEAIVIFHNQIKQHFRYHMKNRGAMLAKGAVLGIQFLAAFQNDLYFELGGKGK